MGQLKSVFRRGLCAPLNDQRKFSNESTYDDTTGTTHGEYVPLNNPTHSPETSANSKMKKDSMKKDNAKRTLSRNHSGSATEPKKSRGKTYIDLGTAKQANASSNHLSVSRPPRHHNFLYRLSRRTRSRYVLISLITDTRIQSIR